MEKLIKRKDEIERTTYLLFQTNLLTLELYNNLNGIYSCLVNEYSKIRGFDYYYKPGYKKEKMVCFGIMFLKFSKEFKKRFNRG
jgi:hypothetical protein